LNEQVAEIKSTLDQLDFGVEKMQGPKKDDTYILKAIDKTQEQMDEQLTSLSVI
jgi:hypothetical protein